jgi:hypothetical protein
MASVEGFDGIGNPKLHPLRDLEVAQFVSSGRVRLGVRSPQEFARKEEWNGSSNN